MPGLLSKNVLEGIGIGLREEYANELLASSRSSTIDWLEVTPENWLGRGGWARRTLDACIERWAMSPHCVSLSLAGPDPFDRKWINEVEAFSKRCDAPFWSDHLACSSFDGVVTGQLFPIPLTDEFLDHTVERVNELAKMAETPLAIENLTMYARPLGDLDEVDFFARLMERTNAGILLDVNTVAINAKNHGFDAAAWLDRVPLDRVWQIHLAGHSVRESDGLVIDDHTGPIPEDVWTLYRRVQARAGRMIPTLIEWDTEVTLDALFDEVARARG